MPRPIRLFVRYVDATNRIVGRITMYMIFAMIGILMYSAIMRGALDYGFVSMSPLWTLEMAQFVMTAYYMLGGGWSIQDDSHVRMDLAYSRWSPKRKAIVDCFTVFFLIVYLGVMLYGGLSSTSYALQYGETSYSSWAPYMAPIKIIMCIGIFLMLLQAIAQFFKDIAVVRGETLA
ncbi:TRAP transporter small permease subunit [Stappia sp. GBMRC 2046]|uniref:TRAP transporter small permease protein n=1 Tax=Stappia sediminis TaxID=2692190 RepID=A0A7X3LTF3_9HYPH|nr:TRAP transporter small permease subunit [Stappia sediminis]MXN64705.1 TRAP transporter small permease subunit [Stappia sediminis]